MIAICIPCMDKPNMLFSQALATLMYQCGKYGTPIALIHQGGSLITRARNQLIEKVQEFEKDGTAFSHIFFLDSDMVFPPMTLHWLLSHDKDIVGCTYVRRSWPFDVHGKTLDAKPRDLNGESLVEVAGLPTGVLLIKRRVFDQFKRPIFRTLVNEEKGIEYGEDYVFCAMARAAGFKIWLDAEVSKQIGHVAERTLYPEEDSWPDHREELKKRIAANG